MTGVNAPTQKQPSEVDQCRNDMRSTVYAILDFGGLEHDRAAAGAKIAADLIMKRLEERGWRPEEGWE